MPGACNAPASCLAPTKHPWTPVLALSSLHPPSVSQHLPAPVGSDRGGHFYPHLTTEQNQSSQTGPRGSCSSASGHITPHIEGEHASPAQPPAQAAAAWVTEARLAPWLTTELREHMRLTLSRIRTLGSGWVRAKAGRASCCRRGWIGTPPLPPERLCSPQVFGPVQRPPPP